MAAINNMLDNNAMQNEEGGASFVYMGEGGPRVPDDVVQVRVDPSVTVIPYRAFDSKKNWRWLNYMKTFWKLENMHSEVAYR